MKGILFNLLEDLVVDEYGFDTWDEMIARAGVSGSYTSVGTYADDDLVALVSSLGDLCSAAGRHEVTDPDVLRWFGRAAMRPIAAGHGVFFEPHERTIDFMLTLNDVIHAEVLKLHPDATVPTFQFSNVVRHTRSSLTLHYTSTRRLCALVEGFAQGAARHYREHASISHPECMLEGADECRIVCDFEPITRVGAG